MEYLKLDVKAQETVRLLAVKAIVERKMTQAEASRFFEVSEGAIHCWMKKYRHGGMSRLIGHKKGKSIRKKALSKHQINAVKKYIEKYTPEQLDLPFILWCLEAVQKLIVQKYKVTIPRRTLSTWLKEWGFSPQKPAKKAMEQNKDSVQKWLSEDYPNIEKRAKKEKAEIHWLDESGIQSTDNRGRSYAKVGQTPSIEISAKRHRANFISTVNKLGTMRFMTYLGKMNSDKLIEFMRRLIKSSDKKIFLIMDNLSVHKSGKVKDWVKAHSERIEIFYLPTYSPDLNPDEYLNRHLKSIIFKEERPDSRQSLKTLTERKLRSIQANKNLVKSYFKSQSIYYPIAS